MNYTQENRFIAIETPLGEDVLLLAGFRGTEGISTLSNFKLDLISENHNVVFEDIIGKYVTISMLLADGEQRFFNGIIANFAQEGGGGETGSNPNLSFYTATMVPWFWLHTQTANSRIFQKLSVPDIVEKIFTEKGFLDYKLAFHENYDKRDYCVQYRETDFNFISRLLEDEGIYYFFEHEKGKHTLVLADGPEDHKPCPKQESARYQLSGGGWLEDDVITSLNKRQAITPSKYTLNDYNFKTPGTDLKVEVTSQTTLAPSELEIYDYPGEFRKRPYGEHRSNLRMQEAETKITTITGSSVCRAFTSGFKFDLQGYYRSDMTDKPYLLTFIDHEASVEESYSAASGSGAGSEFSYVNHFTCIPLEVLYRPPRITPKPVIQGTQTAIVTGPSGQEIYTDEHGRVKVQFHWDREGNFDENSSCWMRVSQVSAGAGWGAIDIPRIGHEVIVDFLEGDPDQPIVTGRVYHGNNKPPTGLPAAGMVSGMKSNSTPGGGGYNEMTMDDTKGKEKITIHGQHNMGTTVGNDQTLAVHNNRSSTIDVNDSHKVGVDQSLDVGSNQDVSIGSNQTASIGSNQKVSIGSNQDVSIGSNQTIDVAANFAQTVGGNQSMSISGKQSRTVGGSSTVTVGGLRTETAGGGHIFTNPRMAMNVGGKCVISAGGSITESSPKVNLNAGSKMTASSGGPVTVKAGGAMKQQSGGTFSIKSGGAVKEQAGGAFNIKAGGALKQQGANISLKGPTKVAGKTKITGATKIKGTTLTVS